VDIVEADVYVPTHIKIICVNVAVIVVPIHQSTHNFPKEIASLATEMVFIVVRINVYARILWMNRAVIVPNRIKLATTYLAVQRGVVRD